MASLVPFMQDPLPLGGGGVADLDAQREVLQLGFSSREMMLVLFGAAVVC